MWRCLCHAPTFSSAKGVWHKRLYNQFARLLCAANATLSFLMAAPKRSLVIIAFAALYVIWGSTYLGIKFSIETIPPFLMAGTRFVLAGMIMYAIAWSQGSLLRRSGCEGRIG